MSLASPREHWKIIKPSSFLQALTGLLLQPSPFSTRLTFCPTLRDDSLFPLCSELVMRMINAMTDNTDVLDVAWPFATNSHVREVMHVFGLINLALLANTA